MQLVQAVTSACEVAGLQAVPALVTKCLQLQDTMAVRFGVMLVGPAGRSGNTFLQPVLDCTPAVNSRGTAVAVHTHHTKVLLLSSLTPLTCLMLL